MKNIKHTKDLLNICDQIIDSLRSSDNTLIQKQLAMIAIIRMKNAIKDETKNANSFLKAK